ncbi:MAG: cytochrome c biogenesis protein CcsA [Smithellaceae bacterium]|nr:cytochrome c biogenesis protein CcsA [Smithellaceae bacterium]
MDILLFKIALGGYFICTVGYATSLIIRRVLLARVSTWILLFAFIAHSMFLLLHSLRYGTMLAINVRDALSLSAWALSGVYLAFQLQTKTRVLGALVSPLALILMIVAATGLGGSPLVPAKLQGGLVAVHVAAALIGEVLLALASLAGVMYLVQDGFIKKRRTSGLSRMLPSLRDMDRINHLSLLWGFPLFTVGVIAGSLWAGIVWGSRWQWDPKQVWTLLVWLVYAWLLHQRLAIGWKGHKAALFSIVALVVLAAAFAIESLLFSTIHNFV